ncbi:unnamed protein product [Chrysodeixis includens]|uniref:EGF-like domain-containing protein n=1 Tax=Chrysodeixis includens TaxID=689277 RepID=A0A9N8L017_CHRIL|nr:unnamed protein product [Chrysodeixis includens]
MFSADNGENPCKEGEAESGACDESALCVRSASEEGFACLCPDGLVPLDEAAVRGQRKCVIPRGAPADSDAAGGGAGGARAGAACAGVRAGRAGRGGRAAVPLPAAVRGRALPALPLRAALPPPRPLRAGPVSARRPHAHRRPHRTCICNPGYAGARCERAEAEAALACGRVACENGARCSLRDARAHCDCPPGYTGTRCERCEDGPECGAGVCERDQDGARCRPDICRFFCLNQGTCSVSAAGAVSCRCGAAWSGERCQRPACVDAACAPPAPPPATRAPPPRSNASGASGARCGITCAHGGHCVRTARGPACACAGAWGGAHCTLYVGHDHACAARACAPPALCVWGPDLSSNEAGAVFCACLEGASCTAPHTPAPAPPGVTGAAGRGGRGGGRVGGRRAGAAGAAGRRAGRAVPAAPPATVSSSPITRLGAFVHARLSDNVEINNPMYLAGEDELEPPHPAHAHNNGGNHFANPVYESMYAPQSAPPEEHASLLAERRASPPAERAALL